MSLSAAGGAVGGGQHRGRGTLARGDNGKKGFKQTAAVMVLLCGAV